MEWQEREKDVRENERKKQIERKSSPRQILILIYNFQRKTNFRCDAIAIACIAIVDGGRSRRRRHHLWLLCRQFHFRRRRRWRCCRITYIL